MNIEKLKKLGACRESIDWMSNQTGTPEELWRKCERGDWLLWLAGNLNIDRKYLVSAALACSQGVENKSAAAKSCNLKTAQWVREEISDNELRAAAYAAYAAADAAYAAYAAYAADAAYAAAYATHAAAYTGAAAAYAAAKTRILKLCAIRVRKVIPFWMIEEKYNAP